MTRLYRLRNEATGEYSAVAALCEEHAAGDFGEGIRIELVEPATDQVCVVCEARGQTRW